MDEPLPITIPEGLSNDQLRTILGNLLHVYTHNPEMAKQDHEEALNYRRKVKSRAPYYNEDTANKVKYLVDRFETENKNLFINAADFGYRVSTLYMRIYHGWEYLNDNMDTPEKKYLRMRRASKLRKTTNGVLIQRKKAFLDVDLSISDKATTLCGEDLSKELWQTRLLNYLEEGKDGTKLEIKGLLLSDEDVVSVQEILASYPKKLLTHVDNNEILVIKHKNEEDEDDETITDETDTDYQ